MSRKVILAVAILVLFVLVFGESTNYRLSNPFVISDTPSKYWVSIAGGSMYPGKYFSYPPDFPIYNDSFLNRLRFILLSTQYVDVKIAGGITNIYKNIGFSINLEVGYLEENYAYISEPDSFCSLPRYKISGIFSFDYSIKKHLIGLGVEYTRMTFKSGFNSEPYDDHYYEYISGIGLGILYKYYFVNIGYRKAKLSPFVEVQLSNSWFLTSNLINAEYYPDDYHIMTAGVRLGLQFGVY
ncbi:MAG: hypothetical protein AB7T10_06255 [bacterium]